MVRVLQDGSNGSVPVEEGVAVTVEEDVGQVVFELEVTTGVFQFSIPVEIQTVEASAGSNYTSKFRTYSRHRHNYACVLNAYEICKLILNKRTV